MNIAILHSAFTESGGAERVVINQARSLKALGHQVTCYVAALNRKRCFPEKTSDMRIKTYLLNLALPKFEYLTSLALILPTASLVSRKLKKYDVILTHHEPAPWIAYQVFRKYQIPYVSYMHHPPRFIYPRSVEKAMGWGHNWDMRIMSSFEKKFQIVKRLDYVAVTNARSVVVNSNNVARQVELIYGIKPTVCSPGVGLPVGNRYRQTGDVLKRLGISKPFILSTSRHTPHKRLDWLVSILSKITKEMPSLTLVLVGAFHPTYTPKLKQMTEILGERKTAFINYVTDEELAFLYREAAVYTYTAPEEDFGLGPVEAMLYATPVVCWDDGAGPSETVVDGITGFKVKPYDLDEFARKTLKILQDNELRRNMGARAAVYVRENFSWDKHAKTLESILETSLRGDK